ncbi:unnamed protein product [Phyllotreta striolata]|uniref:Protein mab-21 n=1 Tax=Phyllotreta striolata TaxID=444603 RepID=A0A9N9TT04_PHYSR|nr:unnamed protein product [Phyllotreta striolata]
MLVPADMLAAQSKMLYQINKYYGERVQTRMATIAKTIREVCKVVQEVLKEVEVQEPRFISSLTECNGKYEGLDVISPVEFEVVLYLNQMGVFNFVDDGTLPGCAVLKLSDGRKRSMSLWVEFITASGYLSARKIRSRFQTLVAQACDKCSYRDSVKLIADTSEVKLRIRERYIVQITPAFKCGGVWPRSASHWPSPHIPWPHPNLVAEVKTEGFDLLSKESIAAQGKQTAMEGDAWVLSFLEAENRLLHGGCRRRCLSILKTLRDRHLDLPGNPVTSYHLKTLLLYECEKHPRETEWDESCIADRINGIFLQLISCLQCKRCPHYFLPNLDLFKGKSPGALENASKQVAPAEKLGSSSRQTASMLVPPDMLAAQSKMVYQLNKYYTEKVQSRKLQTSKTIQEVCRVVQDVLKEVEVQEPRFISSLTDYNGKFDGLEVISPVEFEVVLYLNQMGVLNFVDDGTLPGCAVLKLSDGRKRSMSLWVEFITASGYLSARKMRSRFQTLVAQACDKCSYRDSVKMIADTTEVKLRIRERYIVQITPAFKCAGLWPRSAAHWPLPQIPWPHPNIVVEVKTEGFDLLSKECIALQGKQSAMEGDAWVLSFFEAENRLLQGGCRRRCLSILKTLRDRHLDLPGNPVTGYHMKTLLLYECEKHPRESEWDESCIADRINGIFLQLISCLQCKRCPHYFLPNLDLFKGKSPSALENASKQVWRLTREMLTNSRCFEKL